VRVLVTAGLLVAGLLGDLVEMRTRVERWLYNPRERTERALADLEAGDADAAARKLASAARIRPHDPLVRFNAGAGELVAGDPGAAAEQLARSVESADGELKARALYNLGNAQLAQEDYPAAVAAYKDSLRLLPEQGDAKHNLEIALARLEEQRSRHGEEQETPEAPNPGEEETSAHAGDERTPDPESRQGEDPTDPSQGGGAPRPRPDASGSSLRHFEEQPDMTAEQAAAILEAVENLEREQLRRLAEERREERATGDRDW
jgi:tetratricopeptide (TPR) repeat protein